MKHTASAKDAQGRPLELILDSLLLDQRLVILDQLALQLAELHEQQQWYGALGLDTVVLGDEGLVQLLPLEQCIHRRSLVQARAHGKTFDEPCAAPEQYVDDPLQPAGPWTDVYGYAALRWQLMTGMPLMAAPWRQLQDPVVMDEDADGPTQAMVQGLALDWVQRPQSMSSYRRLERLGQVPESVSEQASAAQPVLPVTLEHRSTLPFWLAGLAVLALAGLGGVYWEAGGEIAGPSVAQPDSDRPTVAQHQAEERLQKPGTGMPVQVGELERKPDNVAPLEVEAAPAGIAATLGTQPGSEQQVEPQPELNVTSGSSALLPVLSAQAETLLDEAGRVALEDHAAGTDGVAAVKQDGVLEPSAQVAQVEQLEPVAAKPAPPAKGAVALDVRPWGEVYVNGRKQGVSPPLKSLSLAPGSHRIVIKNAGLPTFSTTIRVRSGKTASVSHEFK